MTSILMALGTYRFSIETAAYEELRRQHEWRWPSQERVGRKPALQFAGPGEERVEMGGVIYPHYKGGLEQIDAMRTEADEGRPLILVDGRGHVWGKYAIRRIEETQAVLAKDGAPRRQTFMLELAAYGEDDVR